MLITQSEQNNKEFLKEICKEDEVIAMALGTLASLSVDEATRLAYMRRKDEMTNYYATLQLSEEYRRRAEASDRRAEESDRRAEEERRRAEESARRAEEERRCAEEERRRAEASDRRAETSDRRAEASDRRAEEERRRAVRSLRVRNWTVAEIAEALGHPEEEIKKFL